MDPAAIHARVEERLPGAVSALVTDGTKDPFLRTDAARWLELARLLCDDEPLAFDFLQCVTAVDWPKQDVVELVYHLYSYRRRHAVVVKLTAPRKEPVVPSVTSVWPVAEWQEREQFDLMGVGFTGHPDLRRLLLPDDWPGHPLRKDWHEPSQYRGMPTTRPSPLDLLPAFDRLPDDKKRLPLLPDSPSVKLSDKKPAP